MTIRESSQPGESGGLPQISSGAVFAPASIAAMAAANPLRMPVRAFLNGWSNFGGTQTPLTVTVQPGGRLQYEGLIKPSQAYASNQYFFDLPNGFEPTLTTRTAGLLSDQTAGGLQKSCEYEMDATTATPPGLKCETTGVVGPTLNLAQIDAGGYSRYLSGAIYWANTTIADDVAVLVPYAAMDPAKTAKVLIWCHGAGDDYLSHISDGNSGFSSRLSRSMVIGLLNDGWIIVSCTATSAQHWGKPDAWTAQKAAIDWLKSWLSVGKWAVLGQSMGGTLSLRTLAQYPEIRNWYGIYPVCSISSMTGGSFGGNITAAYASVGGLAAVQSQTNPILFPAATWAGKRLLATHSPGDTAVPKAANSDALIARAITGGAAVATVTATTGDHGNASNFTAPLVTAMLAHVNG